jgi:mannan endo-1,4-beta-mannosidase
MRIASFSLALLVGVVSLATGQEPCGKSTFEPKLTEIVRRVGDQLFEGDQVFRFMGLAAPNLQAHESQFRPDFSHRFPDEYEIRDLLGALQQLGSRATRTFALAVHDPRDGGVPAHFQAHRDYNEEAFRCLDLVLALAHEYDVRIILPFIASQSFPTFRGVDEFAALAGKEGALFWTDPGLKEDFKHFLSWILNRKNTYTGLIYKEDPAILAWQLGNEFGSYPYDRGLDPEPWGPVILEWSLEMAAYIKAIGRETTGDGSGGAPREAFIESPYIDVISEHLYEYWNKLGGRPWHLSPLAMEAREQCRGRKPLMIDEFGLGSFENVVELMDTMIEEDLVGGLMWSIRSHRRDGGWYYHNEGGTPVNSFHFPGFANGYTFEETRFMEALRERAFRNPGA